MHFQAVGAAVDRAFPQDLGDNLSHALGSQSFLLGDLVMGPAFAQPGEDSPPPHDPAVGAEPPLRRDRRFVIHANLAHATASERRSWERLHNSKNMENRKGNAQKRVDFRKRPRPECPRKASRLGGDSAAAETGRSAPH